MTTEQFERERRYRVALSIARSMLQNGVIDKEDFAELRRVLIEKYAPFFGGLATDSR